MRPGSIRLKWMAVILVAGAMLMTAPSASGLELVFKDPQYSFQCLRAVSNSFGGAADIGECLYTASRITEGDDESWYREWHAAADARIAEAKALQAAKQREGARREFLKASNYYRTAEFFLRENPADLRIVETWAKGREAFICAAHLSRRPVQTVQIPFENTTLPGYLCLVDNSPTRRPLLIIHTGFDGTAEELYYSFAWYAVEQGYNCLLFEGPGQGGVIRVQKLPFRPDWEKVVTPVVNYALTLPQVDPSRIALYGISFGGYLAPRAAAFEHRIKALVANGGVYDFHTVAMKSVPEEALDDPASCAEIDQYVIQQMKTNPSLRWVMSNAMFTFAATSPSEWMRLTRPYNMKDCADKITCPTLVVDSENDQDMPGQAKLLYDALQCPKEYLLFTVAEGAGEHCQVGAGALSAARIVAWLDRTLGRP